MRTGRLLQLSVITALFASAGAHAGKVGSVATTYYPVDRLYAYTYTVSSTGYPPVPGEYFISGEDMQSAGQGSPPYLTRYTAVIDHLDHIVGGAYSWKVVRYSDWENRVLGTYAINQGCSVAY